MHAEDVCDCVAGDRVAEGERPGGQTAWEELGGDGADGGAAQEGVCVWGGGGAGRQVG